MAHMGRKDALILAAKIVFLMTSFGVVSGCVKDNHTEISLNNYIDKNPESNIISLIEVQLYEFKVSEIAFEFDKLIENKTEASDSAKLIKIFDDSQEVLDNIRSDIYEDLQMKIQHDRENGLSLINKICISPLYIVELRSKYCQFESLLKDMDDSKKGKFELRNMLIFYVESGLDGEYYKIINDIIIEMITVTINIKRIITEDSSYVLPDGIVLPLPFDCPGPGCPLSP